MLKTKYLILYFFLATTLIFSNCKKEDPVEPPPPARTFDDVEADFQAIDLSPGIHDISLEILNG